MKITNVRGGGLSKSSLLELLDKVKDRLRFWDITQKASQKMYDNLRKSLNPYLKIIRSHEKTNSRVYEVLVKQPRTLDNYLLIKRIS